MTIHDKLTRITEDRKLSVIASRAGIPYGSIHGYVKGGKIPGCQVAFRLAKEIGVDLEWLLDDGQGWPPKFRDYSADETSEHRSGGGAIAA